MSNVYFMPKDDRKNLVKRLGEIPALCEDLAITKLRQDRVVRSGGGRQAHDSSRPMYNSGADRSLDALHNELTTWIRHTMCEHRGLDYPEKAVSTIGAALWLRTNITVLALTPGTEQAAPAIIDKIKMAYRAIDLPPVAPPQEIDPKRVKAANRQLATASQIEIIARRLGDDLGGGLDRQRVYLLRRRGLLNPLVNLEKGEVPQLYTEPELFRLGDVLDAHYRHARRNRRRGA